MDNNATSKPTRTTFAEYLLQQRTTRNATPTQSAYMLNTTEKTYRSWENAHTHPRPFTLRILATYFQTTYEELAKLIPEPPQPTHPELATIETAISRLTPEPFIKLCWRLMEHHAEARIGHPAITGYDFTYRDKDDFQWQVNCLHEPQLDSKRVTGLATYYAKGYGPRKLFLTNHRFDLSTLLTISHLNNPRVRFLDSHDLETILTELEDPRDRRRLVNFIRTELAAQTGNPESVQDS